MPPEDKVEKAEKEVKEAIDALKDAAKGPDAPPAEPPAAPVAPPKRHEGITPKAEARLARHEARKAARALRQAELDRRFGPRRTTRSK